VGFFFALFSHLSFYAQVENVVVEISGKVSFKNIGVENAHIVNISNRKNTISNTNGEFTIEASLKDTLEIRCLSFQFETIVISEKNIKNNSLVIELKKRVNELKEVSISSSGLSGDLEKDLQNIPYNVIDPSKKLGIEVFQGEPQEKIPTVLETFGLKKPREIEDLDDITLLIKIDPLYKHISGYYKRLKDKRKFNEGTKTVENVLYFYGTDFFENHYNIKPEQIYNFMFFCLETEDNFVVDFKNENYTELLEIIEKKALLFNKQ